jgi:type IX secretion system PorP/SprF family membrane protein
MKKVILSIAAAFLCIVAAQAQDEAIFGHYLVNPMLINPAYAGFNNSTQINGHLRSQWSGFEDAPKTYAATISLPMTEKVGIGGLLLTEKFGAMDRLRAQLNYAYRYEQKNYKWAFGFSTEFHRSKLAASINDQAASPLVDKNDNVVMDRIKGITIFDASFGAVAEISDKYLFSLSSPNLIRARIGNIDNPQKEKTLFHQVILMAGYRIKKTQVTFEPSIQIRKVYQAPFEVDLNMKAMALDNKLVAALTVRPGNSGNIGLLVGTKQPGFQIFYSYNSSLAQYSSYSRIGHEVTVGVEIAKKENKIERGNKRYRN